MASVVTRHCPLEKVILELRAEGASLGDLPAGIRCLIPHNKRRYPFRNRDRSLTFKLLTDLGSSEMLGREKQMAFG